MMGQIGVIPGSRDPFGYLICKVQHSEARHVLIDVGNGEFVAAEFTGVHQHPMEDIDPLDTVLWSDFNLTWQQAAQIAAFARKQVGKPYAYLDDALIVTERLMRRKWPEWMRADFDSDGQWQCAQLALAALKAGGVDVFPNTDVVGDVSPSDFEQLFLRRGWHTLAEFQKPGVTWR